MDMLLALLIVIVPMLTLSFVSEIIMDGYLDLQTKLASIVIGLFWCSVIEAGLMLLC